MRIELVLSFVSYDSDCIDLPTWSCICGSALVGHSCQEVMASGHKVTVLPPPPMRKRVTALRMMD
jgi:uncharacterized protein YchJ